MPAAAAPGQAVGPDPGRSCPRLNPRATSLFSLPAWRRRSRSSNASRPRRASYCSTRSRACFQRPGRWRRLLPRSCRPCARAWGGTSESCGPSPPRRTCCTASTSGPPRPSRYRSSFRVGRRGRSLPAGVRLAPRGRATRPPGPRTSRPTRASRARPRRGASVCTRRSTCPSRRTARPAPSSRSSAAGSARRTKPTWSPWQPSARRSASSWSASTGKRASGSPKPARPPSSRRRPTR